jgi:hypothetical protein
VRHFANCSHGSLMPHSDSVHLFKKLRNNAYASNHVQPGATRAMVINDHPIDWGHVELGYRHNVQMVVAVSVAVVCSFLNCCGRFLNFLFASAASLTVRRSHFPYSLLENARESRARGLLSRDSRDRGRSRQTCESCDRHHGHRGLLFLLAPLNDESS